VAANAVTDESAAKVVAETTAKPAASPTADAVLDDLPPVLPEATEVPDDTVNGELAAEMVIAEATAKPSTRLSPPLRDTPIDHHVAEPTKV